MELKDSGNRKTWDTGAVRDRAPGKGRMDLMSLSVMGHLYSICDWDTYIEDIMNYFNQFQCTGDKKYLYDVLKRFVKKEDTYDSESLPDLMIEVSKQAEDGANKYADRNWELGMPVSRFVDSAIRHFTQYVAGYQDEPHKRAFIWNVMSAIWMVENKPEMMDYPIDYVKVAEQVATKKKEKEKI